MENKHSLIANFKFAFAGISAAIIKGRNLKIMIGMGIGAIVMGIFTNIDAEHWIDLVLTIALVLGLEMLNTAIESVVDLASPGFNEKAKVAKDVAAGAVLVASLASLAVGAIIFLPKLLY